MTNPHLVSTYGKAMTMHYHYATGVPGYGPDGADGFATADNLNQLAEGVREELQFLIGLLYDVAEGHADAFEFETAWQTHKQMEAFENLRANLDTDRQNAPLYRNDPDKWEATLRTIIDENFPLDVIDGSLRVYAWTCTETDCEFAELACPRCESTNVTPPHGHHLAKCDSCHLAFDTMD